MGSCDNRCTSGKEGTCQCSCGGANHGSAKKAWDVIQDGGNLSVKGSGLDLFLELGGEEKKIGGQRLSEIVTAVRGTYRDQIARGEIPSLKDIRYTIGESGLVTSMSDENKDKAAQAVSDVLRGKTISGEYVQVFSRGSKVQTYRSEKEFEKDLCKLIVAGRVEVTVTDAYNRRQLHLPVDPERSTKAKPQTRREIFQESNRKVEAMAREASKDAASLSDKDLDQAYSIVKDGTTDVAMSYKNEFAARKLGRDLAEEGVSNSDAQDIIESKFRSHDLEESAMKSYHRARSG